MWRAVTAVPAGEVVDLTSLFANHGLTAPPFDFTASDKVRAGSTCRTEILAAFNRLDGDGPPKWHARDDVIAEVRRVTPRYPVGTIRRILLYDLFDRAYGYIVQYYWRESASARSGGASSRREGVSGCLVGLGHSLD